MSFRGFHCSRPSLTGVFGLVLALGVFGARGGPAAADEVIAGTLLGVPAEAALSQIEAAGVAIDVTPEAIVLRAEDEGVLVMRTSRDLETWVVERLPPGEPASFHREQQLTLFRHLATYALDCHPGACPTPKPIPLLLDGNGVPGAEKRPERAPGPVNVCICDDLVTRQERNPCQEECKYKPLRVQGDSLQIQN